MIDDIKEIQRDHVVYLTTLLRMLADQVEERGLIGVDVELHIDRKMVETTKPHHMVRNYMPSGKVIVSGKWHLAPEPEVEA